MARSEGREADDKAQRKAVFFANAISGRRSLFPNDTIRKLFPLLCALCIFEVTDNEHTMVECQPGNSPLPELQETANYSNAKLIDMLYIKDIKDIKDIIYIKDMKDMKDIKDMLDP
ncbi:hypothetical protein C2G38_2161556 [Gigaspora rosea]|uniref:Uncharacterized protein n=1 Tax=Gigaspora rosea TaxID=44941 RepID=A0A397W6S0_9GLOM|nr:hypothetical protein C2G38_2161556 [Gigaspora rosea]